MKNTNSYQECSKENASQYRKWATIRRPSISMLLHQFIWHFIDVKRGSRNKNEIRVGGDSESIKERAEKRSAIGGGLEVRIDNFVHGLR